MTLIAIAVLITAVLGVLGYESWTASNSLATGHAVLLAVPGGPSPAARRAGDERQRERSPDSPPGEMPRHDRRGTLEIQVAAGVPGDADGVILDVATVFDEATPAVANLEPDLLGALRRAATDAASEGVTVYVTSGWRSPDYQEHLLREAIAEHGSEQEAARWVATAETSPHVSGDAVDLGPDDAIAWLSAHGARYGLCQIYSNEPWHFELRPDAVEHGCPPEYADPTHDPRMQQ